MIPRFPLFLNRFGMRAFAVFIVGAILGLVAVQFVPLHVDVQMQTKEKGFLQYYFDTGGGFNETQSSRIQLTEAPNFPHYTASIRAYGLRAIRVDPVEAQGQFEILGLKIDYLFWHRQWFGHEELNYLAPVNEIEVKSTEGAVLSAQAIGKDPNLITRDVEFFKHWQLIATIFCAVLGGVLAILLLATIRYFRGFNAIWGYEHTPLIVIVIVGALFRIIYWTGSPLPSEPNQLGRMWPDEGTYFSIAQYIMTYGFIDYFFSEQSVIAAPANPMYLALMYSLTNSVNAIRGTNLLLSILTIVLVYKLGKRTFNKPVGLLAAGICAIHGQFIQYSATLLTEPLFLCLFIAGIYFLILALETQNLPHSRYHSYALASATFLSLALLTRSLTMLLPVYLLTILGVLEAYRSWRLGKPSFTLFKRAALPLILPILIVGIVATKNYVVFDRFMMATGAGAVLWLGSRADTEGDEPPYRGLTYDTQIITHGASHLSIQGDMLLMEAAKRNIRENIFGYVWWSLKRIGRLAVGSNLAWFYPQKNISDWYRSTDRSVIATADVVFQIILASGIAVYGIIGFAVTFKRALTGVMLAGTAIYFVVFSAPFMTNQRLGLPLVMLLVIPASAVLGSAWASSGKLRSAALIGAPFVLAVVLDVLFLG